MAINAKDTVKSDGDRLPLYRVDFPLRTEEFDAFRNGSTNSYYWYINDHPDGRPLDDLSGISYFNNPIRDFNGVNNSINVSTTNNALINAAELDVHHFITSVDVTGENPKRFYGQNYNEDIRSGPLSDIIFAGYGNDTIKSASGSDLAVGGSGNDSIIAGSGNDEVWGDGQNFPTADDNTNFSSTTKWIFTTNRATWDQVKESINGWNDTIFGGTGNDTIKGGGGNDKLSGDEGADHVFGGDGNDRLDSGPRGAGFADALIGGKGNDVFMLAPSIIDNSIAQPVDGFWDKHLGISTAGATGNLASGGIKASIKGVTKLAFDSIPGGIFLSAIGNAVGAGAAGGIGRLFNQAPAAVSQPGNLKDVAVVVDFDPRYDTLILPLAAGSTSTRVELFSGSSVDVGGYSLNGYGLKVVSGNEDVVAEVFLDPAFLAAFGKNTTPTSTTAKALLENVQKTVLQINKNGIVGAASNKVENYDPIYKLSKAELDAAGVQLDQSSASGFDAFKTADDVTLSVWGAFGPLSFMDPASGTSNIPISGTRFGDVLYSTKAAFKPEHWNDPTLRGLGNNFPNKPILAKGFEGNDIIVGTLGGDTIDGGEGDDWLFAFSGGNSTANRDSILGGNGDDVIYVTEAADGSEQINASIEGGAGNDTLSFEYSEKAIDIDLAAKTWKSLAGGTKTDLNLTVTGIEAVLGTALDDTLAGDAQANVIEGGAGNDSIGGRAGNDRLDGGIGNDTINGGDGNDTIFETRDLNGGNDSINGGNGNDLISGVFGNDTIDGGAGDDTIDGEAGDDSITGGAGHDTLSGSAGNDWLDGGTDNDVIDGGDGDDTIRETTDVNGGHDSITGGNGNDLIYGVFGIDTIEGGAGNDTLDAGENDDIVRGGAGNDSIIGYTGNDNLNGGAGEDTIHAGAGHDSVTGGEGNDQVYGIFGRDTIDGGAGADTLDGGENDDVVRGGAGNDSLVGYTGDDTLDGETAQDIIHGGAGNDSILGGDGNDTLNGDKGDDVLDGGIGDDTINGGDGNDSISFGIGFDSVNGGAGDDTFTWTYDVNSFRPVVNGGAGNDQLIVNLRDYQPQTSTTVNFSAQPNGSVVMDIYYFSSTPGLDVFKTISLSEVENLRIIADLQGTTVIGEGALTQAGIAKNTIYFEGGPGDDSFDASGIEDVRVVLDGAGGDDTLLGGQQGDIIDGGTGNNTTSGGPGRDKIELDLVEGTTGTLTDLSPGDLIDLQGKAKGDVLVKTLEDGKTYVLIDYDGDGNEETRLELQGDLGENPEETLQINPTDGGLTIGFAPSPVCVIEGATSAEIFFGADGRVVIEADNGTRKVLDGAFNQTDLDSATMTVENGALSIIIGAGLSGASSDDEFAFIEGVDSAEEDIEIEDGPESDALGDTDQTPSEVELETTSALPADDVLVFA